MRFVDVVTSKPLTAPERARVQEWLRSPAEDRAFWDQTPADQRHAFEAAQWVAGNWPERLDLVRAALLHDIGKRHASLGPLARAVASTAIKLRLPLTTRWAVYRDHGPLGASELSGAEAIVADFARAHHESRPESIGVDEWRLLVEADSGHIRGR